MAIEYEIGEELDDLAVTWTDSAGAVRDFSGGLWSFEFKLGALGDVALLTKTTGITPAATAPNVTIAFDPEELVLAAASYKAQIRARRISDNKDLITQFDMNIKQVVT